MGKLLSKIFGNKEMRILMLGLDAAGKTSILYNSHFTLIMITVTDGAVCCLEYMLTCRRRLNLFLHFCVLYASVDSKSPFLSF